MKKTALIIVIAIGLGLTIGFFIPPAYQSNTTSNINITPDAGFRTFSNYKDPKWWPGKKINDTSFNFKAQTYIVKAYQLNSASFETDYKGIIIQYSISIVQAGIQQMQLIKKATFQLSTNPIIKLIQRIQLPGAEKEINELHQSIEQFFGDSKAVYGLAIQAQRVKDSALLSVKDVFDHYPTTNDIYKQVNEIKAYIANKQGKEVNYPFLNIRQIDSTHYESMVAIATEKELPKNSRFEVKKMVLGNILFATVTGGLSAIKEGEKQMANYVFDYKKSSPAIPFQSLITDRSAEPDTNKWQTGLYYPVFK
jgi:hypothetical protein